MNHIIIFNEKHGKRIFDASTPELLAKACLKVFTDRLRDGFWYLTPEKDEIDYKRWLRDVKKLVKTQTIGLWCVKRRWYTAEMLMYYRKDAEYEGFQQ